jgi:hypothetical protein
MPKISIDGNYLNVEKLKDMGEQVYTIKEAKFENVAPEDKPADEKWAVYFEETSSGVVLNATRLGQLRDIFGSQTSEDWHGKQVIVYADPDVKFGSKKVGGVAFKAYEAESKLFPKGMKV